MKKLIVMAVAAMFAFAVSAQVKPATDAVPTPATDVKKDAGTTTVKQPAADPVVTPVPAAVDAGSKTVMPVKTPSHSPADKTVNKTAAPSSNVTPANVSNDKHNGNTKRGRGNMGPASVPAPNSVPAPSKADVKDPSENKGVNTGVAGKGVNTGVSSSPKPPVNNVKTTPTKISNTSTTGGTDPKK